MFVGEGEAEQAFLSHLRSLYGTGNPKVTVKSAGGKGPNNILNEAVSTKDATGYDSAAVLMDTDLDWSTALKKRAKANKIELIGASPCLEGLLLDILGVKHPNPSSNATCKAKLHPMLDGKETDKSSYGKIFTKDLLQNARKKVQELNDIIQLIETGVLDQK